jgi:hypothetical protein
VLASHAVFDSVGELCTEMVPSSLPPPARMQPVMMTEAPVLSVV